MISPDQNADPQVSAIDITQESTIASQTGFDIQRTVLKDVTNQSGISDIFQSIKRRSNANKNELRERQQKEIKELSKKYNQIREQLRVQQELMNNRESTERSLQDQLNKATIEVAQLRIIRDDLNSSLKQASAQIQYLTRELEKLREMTAKGVYDRQSDYLSLKEKYNLNVQEMERIKNEYSASNEQLIAERDQLKSQLAAARKQMDQWQDENFRLINEARTISSKYESEKAEFVRNQQKISQLQTKIEKLNDNSISTREENEKMKDMLMQAQSDLRTMTMQFDKCQSEKNVIESQSKSINDQLKETIGKLRQAELAAQTAKMKSDSIEEELNHNKGLLEKTKQKFLNEINNLNQLYMHEKEENQSMHDGFQKATEELNEKSRELELEKRIRERIEKSESALKTRVSQAESVFQESEKERFLLSQQIEKLNEDLDAKVTIIENTEDKLRNALKENMSLKDSLTEAEKKMSSLSSMVNAQTLEDAKKNLSAQLNENKSLMDKLKNLQNENKELSLANERITEEKQNDNQTINELRDILSKERVNLKNSIQERKKIQEQNQLYRQEITDFKRQISKYQSDLSLALAENSHIKEIMNGNQTSLSELIDEKNRLVNELSIISDKYRDEKASHAVIIAEIENHRIENSKLCKICNQLKSKESNLINKLEQSQKIAESYHNEIQQVTKDIESIKKELNEAIQQNTELKRQLSEEQQEKEKFALKCTTLETQMSTLSSKMNSLNKQIKQIKASLSEKSQQLSDTSLQLEQLKDINNHLNEENDSIHSENKKLEMKLQDTEQRLRDQLKNQNDINSKVSSDLQQTIERLKEENLANQDRISVTDAKLKEAQEQVEELQELVNHLQNEAKVNNTENEATRNECFDLRREISENTATIHSLKLVNHEQQELLTQLRDEKKLLKDQINSLEQQNKADRLNLETYYNQNIELLKNQYQTKDGEFCKFENEQKVKISQLENEKTALNQELRKVKRQAAQIILKLKAVNEQTETLNKQREELIKENTDLKTNLVAQVQSFNTLDQQNKKINSERNSLLNRIQELTNKNNDISILKMELSETKMKNEELVKSLVQLQNNVSSLTKLNEDLQIEINASSRAREDASKEFDEIAQTVQQIHLLLKPNDDLVPMNLSTNGQFLQELTTLRNLLVNSQKDIESFIHQRAQILAELSDFRKKTSILTDAQQDYINKLTSANKKIEKLQKDQKNLKDANSKYNIERQNLNDGISKLRTALQLTTEKLSSSETEKKLLKEDKLKMKILLDKICDENKIEISDLEKVP
ncbi:hypothetical protein TRFO_22082 [Tritrichomonas foetus]|uniref:Uncharacterized protein n=1 Tax=Tritrichomonas foetus TaxID=1144522 RepID=A0A1J4KCL8_9EUKA|nr:hypothetical protein TRFO_22082 [Tritrichomonas foetus]|eukprot:OHT09161.1 hypothetical protein TRFO_22082 [Tritrichomonas foetus]